MSEHLTATQIAEIIKQKLHLSPYQFATRDTFVLYTDSPQWTARGYANIALRRLEKEGVVICAGRGKNTLLWRKPGPRPMPEWI